MKMLPRDRPSLWTAASAAGNLSGRFLSGDDTTVTLGDLVQGSILCGRSEEFRGRSVLVAATDQLATALALIELDGVARRLILYPPGLPLEHVAFVMAEAGVDVVISDQRVPELNTAAGGSLMTCSAKVEWANCDRSPHYQTEWVLLTSGTTGQPKMVQHTLFSLAGAIDTNVTPPRPVVWSTFYDIRRYGGLQIFLRAVLAGGSLVLSNAHAPAADFLTRAGTRNVSHISGTPSHWRHALMSPSARQIAPQYVRLSGEIADQAILNHLRSFYPQAVIAHAFASTEAGVAFEVGDDFAGFPASLIERPGGDVEMKIEDDSLRIRSSRTAARYMGQAGKTLADTQGFVDTGDILERRGDRYYFVGRRDGLINVGGMKVHPEEVEAVINRHPQVQMSLVRTRKNPVTGALVVADVVLKAEPDVTSQPAGKLEGEILQLCRQVLPRHKVPAAIHFVGALTLAATGKMVRCHA